VSSRSKVRTIEDLDRAGRLIVPGGESTTIGKIMAESGLLDGIRSYFYKGGPVWGTCAGMVLAASATTGQRQPLLGLMNALVERNGFGRQVHSFEKELEIEGFEEPFVGFSSGRRSSRTWGPG
jgi:5'-phosphate synthase pdxT subunit